MSGAGHRRRGGASGGRRALGRGPVHQSGAPEPLITDSASTDIAWVIRRVTRWGNASSPRHSVAGKSICNLKDLELR